MALEAGKKCLCIPDGRGGYTAYEISAPAVGEKCILLPDGKGGYTAVGVSAPSVGDKVPVVPDGKGGYITWKPTALPTIELSYGWSILFTHNDMIYAGWSHRVNDAYLREYSGDGSTDYNLQLIYGLAMDYKIIGDVAYILLCSLINNSAFRIIVMDLVTKTMGTNIIYFATDYVDMLGVCPYTEPPRYEYLTARGHFGYDGTNLYVITHHLSHYGADGTGGTTASLKIPINSLSTSGTSNVYIDDNYGFPGLDAGLIGFHDCNPWNFWYPITGGLVSESRDCAYFDGDLVVEAYNHDESRWELMTPHSYSYLDTWDTICEMPGTRPTLYSSNCNIPYTGDMYVFDNNLYTISTTALYVFSGSSFEQVCALPGGFTPVRFCDDGDTLYLCGIGGAYQFIGDSLSLIGNPAESTELVSSVTKFRGEYVYGIVPKTTWNDYDQHRGATGRLYPTTV